MVTGSGLTPYRRFAFLDAGCAPSRSVTVRLGVAGSGAGCSIAVCWQPLRSCMPWSALALPEPAVLDPVAAGGHVAPGTCPAVGPVVEGPQAVRVAAGFQPLPGAVALCVADRQ